MREGESINVDDSTERLRERDIYIMEGVQKYQTLAEVIYGRSLTALLRLRSIASLPRSVALVLSSARHLCMYSGCVTDCVLNT